MKSSINVSKENNKENESAKTNPIIENINCKYILSKIIDNMPKKIKLEIVRYNKKIQNILNLSVNDYKEYYEGIEIEIIPVKGEYGKFIHIDNEKPTAKLPEDFVSWHNYMFTDEVVIQVTEISEMLDENLCKVYECPRQGARTEIPFNYSEEEKTLSFKLNKGLHNIDIILSDEAGNEWNIDRVKYLRIGNFRLYLGVGISLGIVGIIIAIVLWRKKRR